MAAAAIGLVSEAIRKMVSRRIGSLTAGGRRPDRVDEDLVPARDERDDPRNVAARDEAGHCGVEFVVGHGCTVGASVARPGAELDRPAVTQRCGTPDRNPEMKRDEMRVDQIDRAILILRGHRVLLDSDLAALYGVEAKALNQAVRRNAERFPADFMFRLTLAEVRALNVRTAAPTPEPSWNHWRI